MESFFLGARVLSLFSFPWHININSLFLHSCFLLQPQGTGTFSWSLCQTEAVFEGVGRHAGSTGAVMSDVIQATVLACDATPCSPVQPMSFVICPFGGGGGGGVGGERRRRDMQIT